MKTHWLVLLLLGPQRRSPMPTATSFTRPRYYTPPGSHRTSHFHIYRINPDGTGKTQLTFGAAEDRCPRWSPDGSHIVFIEIAEKAWQFSLCEINANGGRKRVLKLLSPDVDEIDPAAVLGYRLDNSVADDNSVSDKHRLVDLKTGRRLTLTVPDHDSSYDSSNDVLLPMPGQDLVYAANDHNSTVGVEFEFFRLRPETGALRRLTEGQFSRLVAGRLAVLHRTGPGYDALTRKRKEPYAVKTGASAEEREEDLYRIVWFAPLYVEAAGGGPMRQLTPRLSCVTGVDWRKEK